jgi:hypothetical protein
MKGSSGHSEIGYQFAFVTCGVQIAAVIRSGETKETGVHAAASLVYPTHPADPRVFKNYCRSGACLLGRLNWVKMTFWPQHSDFMTLKKEYNLYILRITKADILYM